MRPGLTQEKCPEEADLAPRVLQKVEAGQTTALITTQRRLRKAIGCRCEALLQNGLFLSHQRAIHRVIANSVSVTSTSYLKQAFRKFVQCRGATFHLRSQIDPVSRRIFSPSRFSRPVQ